jgi:predicted DNA repair protein MutK
MATGLLALLDDVAAIAKVAAASVDDVIGQATKAGAKVSGVVIDDAAVTPAYVRGFAAARELPIVWKIAKGSAFNKIVILLPLALLLSAYAPWAIAPLLMLGGGYLCYEGAEKVWGWLNPTPHPEVPLDEEILDAVHLEERKVRGAIKTDFILSAEIMTIALAALEIDSLLVEAVTLALVGMGITALVYGAVALVVKADDIGLHLAREGHSEIGRRLGLLLVREMPRFLRGLTLVGTVAMLWVGGAILTHGLAELGWHGPEEVVHTIAHAFAALAGLFEWLAGALLHGVLGFAIGTVLMPVAHRAIVPALAAVGWAPDDDGH